MNSVAQKYFAISLSRVFTKGNLGCYAPAGMGKEIIGDALADMLDENAQSWGLTGSEKCIRALSLSCSNLQLLGILEERV